MLAIGMGVELVFAARYTAVVGQYLLVHVREIDLHFVRQVLAQHVGSCWGHGPTMPLASMFADAMPRTRQFVYSRSFGDSFARLLASSLRFGG
jgi:hypothetical protein